MEKMIVISVVQKSLFKRRINGYQKKKTLKTSPTKPRDARKMKNGTGRKAKKGTLRRPKVVQRVPGPINTTLIGRSWFPGLFTASLGGA